MININFPYIISFLQYFYIRFNFYIISQFHDNFTKLIINLRNYSKSSLLSNQMAVTFYQQFQTLFSKHLLNYMRNQTYIKELIGIVVVSGLCYLLNQGGGDALQNIPMYMPLAIMLFCRGSVLTWVSEKQNKHVEVQKIMGASFSAYMFSWISFFLINGLVLSIIFIAILSIVGVFSSLTLEQIIKMLILYFLLMVAIFNFCMMISSFFSDSQLAAQVTTFMQLLGVGLFQLLKIDAVRNSQIGVTFISFIPSVCFQIASLFINKDTNPYRDLPFSASQGYITLILQIIVYFILFMYFQAIIPNENGTHLHPLFFLKRKSKQKRQHSQLSEISQRFQVQQPYSSARFHQKTEETTNDITCAIKNLNRSFGNKKVVDNLGFKLYKKQIFCLLGHNGAGKSTTINMLTGILKPDSGQINILGYDSKNDMSKIRQKVGVCLQKDVLYDRLTVRQHLQFFGKLKGFFGQQLEEKVNQIVKKCCLQTETYKYAITLSGGNKRKLCLACAAIGDSQLIFLDEPSSGMDPNTRRNIWGMINQLKQQGKTIVLTTHHLQQAEALSDRIGILANGQLIILGSCHYIKDKFGVGYYLKVNLQNFSQAKIDQQKKQILQIVSKIVGEYKLDDQVASYQMKILLTASQQKSYSELFQILQQKQIQFTLTMSSLEDVFIRIGQDPESVLNNQPLPEIQKIQIPKHSPHYQFFSQLRAVFTKKRIIALRAIPLLFFFFLLPTLYISLGAVIVLILQTPSDGAGHYAMIWAKFYILGYFMTIGYSFNTSTFCGGIVAQRQIKFKYISFVMGMRKIPYWTGTLLFDIILFAVPFLIVCIIIACFPSQQSEIFVEKFGLFFILFLAFSLSFLTFTYLWTHAFQKAQTAYRFFPFFVMLVFAILPQVPILTQPHNQTLKLILPILSPLLAFVNGMISQDMVGTQAYNYFIQHGIDVYMSSSIWYSVCILLIQSVVYMTITIVLDNVKFRLNDRQFLGAEEMNVQRSEDLLKQQRKIIQKGGNSPIVVDCLYKKFSNGFIAIKDNSFLVQEGQTFGLLGPNGAGKSTTFNILTAAQPKTHGVVKLLGHQVNRSVMEIFNEVGVCPQFNPIYDNMTVKQHLQFFARLKGLSGDQMQAVVNFYIKNLQLIDYKNQKAGTLSGGNKRKLCVCISLIGNPALLFLDQPSAGVDAISRRYLWNILSSFAKQAKRSIILTTHSIHEAQSLCKRIGILIKGQFICIGSPNQLKKRYGKGFRINVKCFNEQNIQKVKMLMQKNYKQYQTQLQNEELKLSYLIPKQNFKFSQAFHLFYNELYQNKIVKQYQISENSLEDVFIQLSKLQPEPQSQHFQPTSKFCCWQRTQKGCKCIF